MLDTKSKVNCYASKKVATTNEKATPVEQLELRSADWVDSLLVLAPLLIANTVACVTVTVQESS